MLMHILITGGFSLFASIEASCSLRFAPFWRGFAIKSNPGLWGHFFPLVQLAVINAFSVPGTIICKSWAGCLRGAPCRAAPRRSAGAVRRRWGSRVAPELLPKQLLCEHRVAGRQHPTKLKTRAVLPASRWPREPCKFPRHLLRSRFACPRRGGGTLDAEGTSWDEAPKTAQEKEKKKKKKALQNWPFPFLPTKQSQRDVKKRFPPYCQGLSFPGSDPGRFRRFPSD